jgi:hypothetical protein
MNRAKRAEIATDTVAIVEAGFYVGPDGTQVTGSLFALRKGF